MPNRFLFCSALSCCLFFFNLFSQEPLQGYTFSNKKLDSTFFYHKRQLEIAQKGNKATHLGLKYWELGDFYYKVGVYSEAMDQFNKALKYLENPNDTSPLTEQSFSMSSMNLEYQRLWITQCSLP